MDQHEFTSCIEWTGDRGEGARSYGGYDRTWIIAGPDQPLLRCSNDPRLGGDPNLPNPEVLLISSLSACHMLWYLHLAGQAGIVVVGYRDVPVGLGESSQDGSGRFLRAILRPVIDVRPGADLARADQIHHEIAKVCFIARSVNFPVSYEATYRVAAPGRPVTAPGPDPL